MICIYTHVTNGLCLCASEERLKNGEAALGDSESLASSSTSTGLAAFASTSSGPSPNASSVLLSKDMASMLPPGMEDHLSQANAPVTATAMDESPATNDSKDPINAIWSFEGHVLRELQPSEKNPQHANSASEGDDAAASPARETDEDGYPILYGSCGRDKKYARCSVCYFRGLRCNSSHYCACCQRPVCIRPRKYPGEEHPKICWNVLHTDKDMVQRVEKKKRRRLQAVGMSSSMMTGGGSSTGDGSMKSDLRAAASAAALHASSSASLGANALGVARSSLQDMTPGTTPPADAGGDKEVVDI